MSYELVKNITDNINNIVEHRLELIKENLDEIIGLDKLEELVKSNKTIKVYWGTSPTGKPHIGYLIPLIKIAQLVQAGCEVTILFADLHAYLDSMKTSWDLLELRTKYYTKLIKQILIILKTDLDKIKFIKGTDYQLDSSYTIDLYKFTSAITVDSAQKGGAEVVKQSSNPPLSGLVYPLLQVLDEKYLECDIELGGLDQRKIFMLSKDHGHKISHKSPIYLMNPMIPSISSNTKPNLDLDEINKIKQEHIEKYVTNIEKLKSKNLSWSDFENISKKIFSDLETKYKPKDTNKMSSSDINSKIDFFEDPKSIRTKISKAWAEPSNPSNTLLIAIKYIVFPINKLVSTNTNFIINRDEKYGGILDYSSYLDIESDYIKNKLSPQDLKLGLADWLVKFLCSISDNLDTEEFKELTAKAYPKP